MSGASVRVHRMPIILAQWYVGTRRGIRSNHAVRYDFWSTNSGVSNDKICTAWVMLTREGYTLASKIALYCIS
jgi:hypothetical protein